MGVGTPVVALPHSAEAVSILAVAIVGYCGIRLFRLRREIRNLNQAEQGERRIAELLAPLRAKRYVTFNDVLVTNANIDHVLVGPTGIFAIETKTYSVFGDEMCWSRRIGSARNWWQAGIERSARAGRSRSTGCCEVARG